MENIKFDIATLLSHRTGEGFVQITVAQGDAEIRMQLTLDKAREIRAMLDGAIEAAVSDYLIWKFLHERLSIPKEAAAAALMDFREMRQGGKGTVVVQ